MEAATRRFRMHPTLPSRRKDKAGRDPNDSLGVTPPQRRRSGRRRQAEFALVSADLSLRPPPVARPIVGPADSTMSERVDCDVGTGLDSRLSTPIVARPGDQEHRRDPQPQGMPGVELEDQGEDAEPDDPLEDGPGDVRR